VWSVLLEVGGLAAVSLHTVKLGGIAHLMAGQYQFFPAARSSNPLLEVGESECDLACWYSVLECPRSC
jgi:hypothetical protein